ncbi:hypothetical protein [Streptomyces sp. NPDC051561]|uniref:hypothetical protein n=1 Tax=Streptomyces sp. NPDC051561 TaxID=3365658 RepID=UPI00379D2EBC
MIGLSAVVVFTVLLPFAGASAGPADSEDSAGGPAEGLPVSVADVPKDAADEVTPGGAADARAGAAEVDAKVRGAERAHARCGPEVVSPEGVEAQTCVLTERRETWARTYYRNVTGAELHAVLTLMGPAGRTVRMHCAVRADDEPGACETPHEKAVVARQSAGGLPEGYTAITEFAGAAEGPLLLRSGSNSVDPAAR